MSKCRFQAQIDEYLLNKLSEDKRHEFEEHYFNCPLCFQEMVERDEMIATIKIKGEEIFQDLISAEQPVKVPLYERISGFLTPKQWAVVAVSAALILIVTFGVIPSLKTQSPQFFLTDDQVRGQSITLISDAIPSQFQWESMGENVEYKIFIENHETLWSETTQNNHISLPAEIKAKMTPGVKYFWQVKAYSPEGILIAESSKVQFTIDTK